MKPGSRIRAAATEQAAAFKRMVDALGSAATLSWPVVAIYCPVAIVIQTPNASLFGGPRILWILASAIGMVSLVAVLAVARLVTTSGEDHPAPRAVLASYALAALAQGVTFGFASVALGATDAPHLSFRVMGLFVQFPLLLGVGYAVARHDAHRRVLTELRQTQRRLLKMGRSVDSALDRAEADLSRAVRESIEPAVVAFDAVLADAAAGGGKPEVIGAIDAVVEERVRPLAHELAFEDDSDFEIVDSDDGPRPRVPLPARFRVGDAIKPGLAALVLVVGGLASAVRELSPGSALLYLIVFSFLVWLLLTLARRFVGPLQAPTIPGAAAVVFLYAAAGAGAYWLTGESGLDRPEGIAISAAAFFATVGFAIVASQLVGAQRAASEGALAADTLRLEESVALIRRRERLVRRRLAFVVHGALQGALHAAALRIGESDTVTGELGREIRNEIDVALSQIDSRPGSRGSLATALTVSELSSVWSGNRNLQARLSDSAKEALLADSDADEAAAEVIREAVGNAFRHGQAGTVEVTVDGAEAVPGGALFVSVRDDGIGVLGPIRTGLGTALFDDLCREWTLGAENGRTVFRGRITLKSTDVPVTISASRKPVDYASGSETLPDDTVAGVQG